jgi:Fic-DOC domain mobile mystery protein B
MSKFKIVHASNATPIDPDEIKDLIPDYISTMGELNQVEQSNIADAFIWADRQDLDELFTATFVFKLHERMFNQVWKWAGKTRRSNKNIGVMKEHIMNDIAQLLADVNYWVDNAVYAKDEAAVRFHHRLVQIHIFPNGNGRHARLMTDLFLKKYGEPKFSWGTKSQQSTVENEGKTRDNYIAALKSADTGDFRLLMKFVRN